jgi:transketolase
MIGPYLSALPSRSIGPRFAAASTSSVNAMTDLRQVIIDELIAFRESNLLWLIVVDSKRSSGALAFESECHESFLDLGVMEQTAIDVAAGISASGTPVALMGIGTFLTMRCYEQIRSMLAYGNYNVKLFGLWSGLYYSIQGHTHTQVEDFAIMCPLPNIEVYCPSTAAELRFVTRKVLAAPGAAYVRVENPFEAGEHLGGDDAVPDTGFRQIRTGTDLVLVATGSRVSAAVRAADALSAEGVSCGVANAIALKPFAREKLLAAARGVCGVITIEEHRRHGGLGSIVSQALCEAGSAVPMRILCVPEDIGLNLTLDEARDRSGVSVERICEAGRELVGLSRPRPAAARAGPRARAGGRPA